MAKREPVPFTTPVGRIVWGKVDALQARTDNNNQPKIIQSGDNQGQPLMAVDFGLAIPKTQPTWQQEPWGAAIAAEGLACWPAGQTQRHDFAWKITDGDSTIPNKNGTIPNQREGYAGHWVLAFSSVMRVPHLVQHFGGKTEPLAQGTSIATGDYVQVGGNITSNESIQTAGLYLNADVVCLRVKGQVIISRGSVDVNSFGFGGAAVPTNAATAASTPPVSVPAPAPAAPPVPSAPPQVPVTPLPPTLPPTPPAPRMVTGPDGQRHDYAGMIGAGWNDALLQANGYTL